MEKGGRAHDLRCSRGPTGKYMGSIGLNAAQPDQPWGSTLTFQRIAKRGPRAARVLSRGVTMHPRGRHLREGGILRSHGKSPTLAREQHTPLQPHDQSRRLLATITRSKLEGIDGETKQIHGKQQHQQGYNGHDYHKASPAIRQSGELYCVKDFNRGPIADATQTPTESPQGHRATWCRNKTG